MDKARLEARVDAAVKRFGVAGRDVVVAILDRGLDWKNNDFRNADGTTRIEEIFDLSDDSGANAANNPYKAGTIYTRAQINAALTSGNDLVFRDAVGHGTATTGIATGNGRNSRDWKYRGEAPKAIILVVKIVSGAAAHDDQPAEAFTQSGQRMTIGIDYVRDKAKALGLPTVMLPNIGSVGGPMDGTSTIAKKIDATVGPGKQGLIFVTGSSDDGGIANHASTTIASGASVTLQFEKLDANSLRFDVWYPQTDRYDITVQTPAGTVGPYTSPATNAQTDSKPTTAVNYFHYGSDATPYGVVSRRECLIDFSGAAGMYSVTLRATSGSGGKFDAWLGTVNGKGRFLNNIVPGYTVWDAATAFYNIAPNDYVLRNKWANQDGVVTGIPADHVGDLWEGSGIGPLVDGRIGVDVSAPGNTVFTSLAPKSAYSAGTKIQDGNGFYTAQNAVSGASPQVTGIIALMLEINPTLDAKQVKDILQQTARRDDFTGAVPNPRWGYGKIDAEAAILAASRLDGARPYFSLDENVISIDFPQASAAPKPQVLALTATGGSSAFKTSSSASWLSVDLASGNAPAQLSVKADPAGLALGDYSGEITISPTDGRAVPQTVMVHLHVRTPGPLITSVEDGAAYGPGFANGSWVTIRGYGLANTTRIWTGADFQGDALPTALNGTSVVMLNRNALVYYISPTQLNVLAADNPTTNTRFAVQVTNNGVRSNAFVANSRERNPEFFRFDGRYIAATFLNGDLVGKLNLFPGGGTRPPKPGETIQMFGTGCGATNPVLASDRIIAGAAQVTGTVKLTIGGVVAKTSFVGLSGNGLCQVNAEIPNLPSGDAEVVLQIDDFVSAYGAFITVQ